jgi:hypothetical protein
VNFERFPNTRGKGTAPQVSITKSGQLMFSRGAVVQYSLAEGCAELYYDRSSRTIGIKPVGKSVCGFSMRLNASASSLGFTCKKFLAWAGIDHQETCRYDVTYSTEYGMYVATIGGDK